MKSEFYYHRKNGRDSLQVQGMSLLDIAAEPAYIARRLYSSILRQEPSSAEAFKKAVIQIVTDPVTWDVSKAPTPDIEMLVTAPGGSSK